MWQVLASSSSPKECLLVRGVGLSSLPSNREDIISPGEHSNQPGLRPRDDVCVRVLPVPCPSKLCEWLSRAGHCYFVACRKRETNFHVN